MTKPPSSSADVLRQVCVCYLLRTAADGRTEVLLGRKKFGLGVGNYVGPGGKLEAGESALQAIVREVHEEVGLRIRPANVRPHGLLSYYFPHKESWSQESSVFVCEDWSGEPVESDELAPEWFAVDELPLEQMWDDARHWLPDVLAGQTVRASFTFGADLATVVSHSRQ